MRATGSFHHSSNKYLLRNLSSSIVFRTWKLSQWWGHWMMERSEFSKTAAAAAAKSLQSCLTLCDPIDGSPPGSPVPGFSRQEHWNGLPLPSPMHESEKWKWSCSVASDSLQPHGLQPTRLLHPWDFPGKSTGVGCHCLLRLKDYLRIFAHWWYNLSPNIVKL